MAERPAEGENGSMLAAWVSTTPEEAQALLAGIYGIAGIADRLSSERDDTFFVSDTSGGRYVLKIANPAEDQTAIDFQNGALLHLEASAPAVPIPRLGRTLEGSISEACETVDGRRNIRLLTYIDGELQYRMPASPAQSRNLGKTLAQLQLGLEHYHGLAPRQKLMWDISHTLDLREVVDHVDPSRRPAVDAVLEAYERALPAIARLERRQIIHNDFNPHNILLDPQDPSRIAGVIDFGDMVHAPVVNDLAVALSYQLATEDWMQRMAALLDGFASIRPLLREELDLLPLLVRARLAMSVIIAEWRSALRPENRAYIMRNHAIAWRGLQNTAGLAPDDLLHFAPQISEA